MSDTIIKVDNISKQYRLGTVGTGTLSHDLNRWWHRVRGKEDPYLQIGEVNDRSTKGTSDYVWALRDINFEVKQGEVLGIIGKNGAGKSTLLKILSQVTGPTLGTIKAKGRIASLLEVGTGFHPELTGRDNIFLNGTILGMTKKEVQSKLDEIVDFAGVARYIDTPVKRYSSGMMVRLGFAVAAHLDPEILVVDEVLAVGDAEFQKKAIGKMQDVSKGEGRTVLFVSHNMASVRNLCQRGILLVDGTLHKMGEVNDVINTYLERYSEESRVWEKTDEPGVDLQLLYAAAKDHLGGFGSILQGESVDLIFRLKLKKLPKAHYGITILLYDEMNNLVFVSGTGKEEYGQTSSGTYQFTSTIPSNILLKGSYRIGRLLLIKNKGTYITEWKDVLHFNVATAQEDTLGWQGPKQGIVGPNLNWRLEYEKE